MKLNIQKLMVGLASKRKVHEGRFAFDTAEDYMAMERILRLIQSEAPQLVGRVEEIWEGA
jgi:hypothetical protein